MRSRFGGDSQPQASSLPRQLSFPKPVSEPVSSPGRAGSGRLSTTGTVPSPSSTLSSSTRLSTSSTVQQGSNNTVQPGSNSTVQLGSNSTVHLGLNSTKSALHGTRPLAAPPSPAAQRRGTAATKPVIPSPAGYVRDTTPAVQAKPQIRR